MVGLLIPAMVLIGTVYGRYLLYHFKLSTFD